MTDFKNKYGPWALLTGGTSGIGAEFANQLAEKGLNIVLVARRQNLLDEKAAELKNKYGVEVKTIQADLTKNEDLQKIQDGTNDLEIGLLIPCAALENHGLMTKLNLEKELAVIQINVTSTFALAHYFGGKMVERKRGGILFLSSMIGHMPNPYFANYAATKAYILNLGTSLNGELKKHGVDVTVLSPGPTETPMLSGTDMDTSKLPMSIQTPDYVAKVGLDALGKKPVVIPGFKNNLMVTMTNMMPIKVAIKKGADMIEEVLDPEVL